MPTYGRIISYDIHMSCGIIDMSYHNNMSDISSNLQPVNWNLIYKLNPKPSKTTIGIDVRDIITYDSSLTVSKPFDNKPSHSTCCHLAIGSGTKIIPIQ